MTAAVENARAFLQMDLANLDNRQQAEIVNTQLRVDALLEDSKAKNADDKSKSGGFSVSH